MKRPVLLSVIIFLSLPIVVYAAGIGETGTQQKHTWELGTEISQITYKEPGVMEEEGMMYGLSGSYTYRGWVPAALETVNRNMFKIEGRFSFGQVDYKNSGTIDNIDDYLWEFRGLGGYDFPLSAASTITPYIGFGYRYLNDDSSGMTSSTGALGYERESNYFYSPIGVEITAPLESGWTVGAIFEYDHLWKGIQKSHLSDAVASFNDLKNDQNKGFGFRASLKFEKQGEKVDFIIEPFLRYWNIKKSEETGVTYAGVIVGYGYEPKNNSTEIGTRVTARF